MPLFDENDDKPTTHVSSSASRKVTRKKPPLKSQTGDRRPQSVEEPFIIDQPLPRSQSDPGDKPVVRVYKPSNLQNIEDDEMETDEAKVGIKKYHISKLVFRCL